MDDFDLISSWLSDKNLEVKIDHMFGSDTCEFRINYEVVDLSNFEFFRDPLRLCKTAIEIIDMNHNGFKDPVAGKIVTNRTPLLFQFFPGNYGFSAKLSSLPDDKYAQFIDDSEGFHEQLIKILARGWHDSIDTRFTKFELLRDNFKIRPQDTLEHVRKIRSDLIEEQSAEPRNAGGHTSDHFTWYQNGVDTCNLILRKYGSQEETKK